MDRPGSEPRITRSTWTTDELCECYEELGAVEPLEQAPAADVEAEGDAIELVSTLEGEALAPAEAPRAGAEATGAGFEEAETYEVLPELELLDAILDACRAESPDEERDEGEAREDEEEVATFVA